MTTTASTRQRLERKVRDVARSYRRAGYDVVVEPKPSDLPPFLQDFRPAMVATKKDDSVVIEIKSKEGLQVSHDLPRLTASVNAQPGWRLELVVTNPRIRSASDDVLDASAIWPRLKTARSLFRESGPVRPPSGEPRIVAAFLLLWSTAEAAMRLVAIHQKVNLDRLDPIAMVKQLSTLGVLDRADYEAMETAAAARNAIVHGFKWPSVDTGLIDKVSAVAERLLEELPPDARGSALET